MPRANFDISIPWIVIAGIVFWNRVLCLSFLGYFLALLLISFLCYACIYLLYKILNGKVIGGFRAESEFFVLDILFWRLVLYSFSLSFFTVVGGGSGLGKVSLFDLLLSYVFGSGSEKGAEGLPLLKASASFTNIGTQPPFTELSPAWLESFGFLCLLQVILLPVAKREIHWEHLSFVQQMRSLLFWVIPSYLLVLGGTLLWLTTTTRPEEGNESVLLSLLQVEYLRCLMQASVVFFRIVLRTLFHLLPNQYDNFDEAEEAPNTKLSPTLRDKIQQYSCGFAEIALVIDVLLAALIFMSTSLRASAFPFHVAPQMQVLCCQQLFFLYNRFLTWRVFRYVIGGLPKIICGEIKANDTNNNNSSYSSSDLPDCVICCESAVPQEVFTSLPCGHCFHAGCFFEWLKRSSRCPVCRAQVLAGMGEPEATDEEVEEAAMQLLRRMTRERRQRRGRHRRNPQGAQVAHPEEGTEVQASTRPRGHRSSSTHRQGTSASERRQRTAQSTIPTATGESLEPLPPPPPPPRQSHPPALGAQVPTSSTAVPQASPHRGGGRRKTQRAASVPREALEETEEEKIVEPKRKRQRKERGPR